MKIFIYLIGLLLTTNIYAYVEIVPPFLFLNDPKKSTQFEIRNNSDLEVEIWFELKYGYVTNDDSGKIIIKTTDTYEHDDQVATTWITIYPSKSVLKPRENRFFRIIVNPPLNLNNGEYWSRIFVNSKPLNKKLSINTNQNNNPRIGFEIQNQQSIPFHYRRGTVTTGVNLNNPEIIVTDKEIIFGAKYTRYGNSSFWGIINYELRDKTGKIVKSYSKNIAVYKTLKLSEKLEISGIKKGEYVLRVKLEAKRNDNVNKHIIKTEPKSWDFNIKLQ